MRTVGKQFRVSIHVTGVKKRCRKADRHVELLGYEPLSVSYDKVREDALAWIKANMRAYQPGAYVKLNLIEFSNDSGVGIETWLPFGPGHVRLEVPNA